MLPCAAMALPFTCRRAVPAVPAVAEWPAAVQAHPRRNLGSRILREKGLQRWQGMRSLSTTLVKYNTRRFMRTIAG